MWKCCSACWLKKSFTETYFGKIDTGGEVFKPHYISLYLYQMNPEFWKLTIGSVLPWSSTSSSMLILLQIIKMAMNLMFFIRFGRVLQFQYTPLRGVLLYRKPIFAKLTFDFMHNQTMLCIENLFSFIFVTNVFFNDIQ